LSEWASSEYPIEFEVQISQREFISFWAIVGTLVLTLLIAVIELFKNRKLIKEWIKGRRKGKKK